MFNLSIISTAVLEDVSPTQGYYKKDFHLWARPGPGIKLGLPAWQAAAHAAQPSTTTPKMGFKAHNLDLTFSAFLSQEKKTKTIIVNQTSRRNNTYNIPFSMECLLLCHAVKS
jgi:hypothetical protein